MACDVTQLWRHNRWATLDKYIIGWNVYSLFHWCINCWNPSRNAEVIVQSKVARFYCPRGRMITTITTTADFVLSDCMVHTRHRANYNGAYKVLPPRTEAGCIQMCMSIFPACYAVDFELRRRRCHAHHSATGGLELWQPNPCCNRIHIVCQGTYL